MSSRPASKGGALADWGPVLALIAAKLGLHLGLAHRYGYHRDELYFIDCGRHLDWGYVDHAPLVPWIARIADELFGGSLIGLRLFSAVASAGLISLTAALVAALRGGRFAMFLAGLAVFIAPAYLRMGAMLNIVVFEQLVWSGATLLTLRALGNTDRRSWVAVGVVAGLGLMTKHTVLLWGVGAGVALLLISARRFVEARGLDTRSIRPPLATAGPWLALVVALVIFAPNIWWQLYNGAPTWQFISNMRATTLAKIPAHMFVLGQVLYLNPVCAPLWGYGLVRTLRERSEAHILIACVFIIPALVLVATGGKPYYLAAAFPALLATGAIGVEQWATSKLRRGTAVAFLSLGLGFAALSPPLFSLATINRAFGAMFGAIIDPYELTHDLHDMYGWPEQPQVVARTLSELNDKPVAIVARNYGEASALSFWGAEYRLPPAYSGHMSHDRWGQPPEGPLLFVGWTTEELTPICAAPERVGIIENPLAHRAERSLPLVFCREPGPMTELWPRFKHYAHGKSPDLGQSPE